MRVRKYRIRRDIARSTRRRMRNPSEYRANIYRFISVHTRGHVIISIYAVYCLIRVVESTNLLHQKTIIQRRYYYLFFVIDHSYVCRTQTWNLNAYFLSVRRNKQSQTAINALTFRRNTICLPYWISFWRPFCKLSSFLYININCVQ